MRRRKKIRRSYYIKSKRIIKRRKVKSRRVRYRGKLYTRRSLRNRIGKRKANKFWSKRKKARNPYKYVKSKRMMVELLSARKYYGRPSVGSVVLVNGHVAYHAANRSARDFYNDVIKENRKNKRKR